MAKTAEDPWRDHGGKRRRRRISGGSPHHVERILVHPDALSAVCSFDSAGVT